MSAGANTQLGRRRRAAVLSSMLGLAGLVAALGIGEVGVRALAYRDLDGNMWVGWRRLKPYSLPVRILERAAPRARDARSHFSYDADLGWLPTPGLRTEQCVHDEQGLRTWKQGQLPAAGGWRIGLFGDSFVYGSDVSAENSMAALLENDLSARSLPVVVSNYGVPGYGVDQSFLRWRKHGRGERDVVLGIPRVDVARNLNVVKAVYMGFLSRLKPENTLPFTKPRFRLERGILGLVNQPPLTPEAQVTDLRDPSRSALLKHEGLFDAQDYRRGGLRRSALWCLAEDVWSRNRFTLAPGTVFWADDDRRLFGPDSESRELLLAVLDAFASETKASGAELRLLLLPDRDELARALTGRHADPHYAEFWSHLRGRYPVIDPVPALVSAARTDSLDAVFMPGGHYSRTGNEIVARTIASALGH